MVVRQGKAQVEPGDVVEPGQVLISGSVPIISDDGEVVNVQYVHGDGDIYARTEKTYTSPVSKLVACRTRTGTVRHGLRLGAVLGGVFPPPVRGLVLGDGLGDHSGVPSGGLLSAGVDRAGDGQGIQPVRAPPGPRKSWRRWRKGYRLRKSETFLKKGVPIIENDVRILDKGTSYEIQAHFVVEEQIGIGQKLEQKERSF